MEKSLVYTSTILIVLCFVTLGTSIHCFQCNSAENPECSDLTVNNTESIFYRPCKKNETADESFFCRKYATTVLGVKDQKDSVRIFRSCGWINTKNITKDTCSKDESDFIEKITCTCFSDGCNSSTRIYPSEFLFFIGLFLYILCQFE
ncbi:uncharacterized protein LOC130449440 [Diorhabda sublineata]|uniref:uncharacterized protein LOC130449440 n=1 Tax=Diorhabda sublineata TaxID=1163346 RepID=UPI0024E0B18C|nr:uncharacterized protein LOC130449440 [Diorhabda sublineata]XP_056643233.1 uncharacterized protein LOC130449440 [Diorhabda sublineata]